MHISVITLFPDIFDQVFSHSIVNRAITKEIVSISPIQLRQFASDSYGSVDDHPYGGGHGMVLRVDVVDRALSYAKERLAGTSHSILLDARGTPYKQKIAKALTTYEHLILVCGHYEGVDERVVSLVDECISIGDYIQTGGEIPAMVIIDSVVRLLPKALSKEVATADESFSIHPQLLEYPHYTRPDTYNSMRVPPVLLSGNHKDIAQWREDQAKIKTKTNRPDLL